MSTLSTAAIASRKITIYSSVGTNGKTIEFTGTIWKELKEELRKNGYRPDEMTAIEGVNRHELSVDNAIIPAQDFYLFLYPVETKSGAKAALPTKKALTEEVKAIVSAEGEDAKAFFKGFSKLDAEELNSLLKKWARKSAAAKAKKAAAPKSAAKSAPKAATKKTTASEVLATAPVAVERDPRDVQAEYGQIRNELSRNYGGKYNRVRG